MIANPYEVLGVGPNATDQEIKKAYRELSRKYHPDSYVDNPLADLAEEKFKQVQEAYDQIMEERQKGFRGGSGAGGGQAEGPFTGGQGSDSQDPVEMQAVYNYINSRHYREALHVLAGMGNRTARWYYCSAIANAGLGNNGEALSHARQAAAMEPSNREYTGLVNQLEWAARRYQSGGFGSGGGGYSMGNFCCDLWLADTCCECMGGDLCSCI